MSGDGGTGERIAKVLGRAGVASRREAERMIVEGRVRVNGRVIESPALNVTATDRVMVDGAPLPGPDAARLWLYHKPTGLVTSARDEKGRTTVFDTLPGEMPKVMPVGRLDITSEGLLLLTNDGGLKRRLELPSTGWLRRYRVRVHGVPSEAALQALRAGLVVEGERFRGMTVTLDRQKGANAWLTVGLREGRNREIRRAMEAVGLTVNRLIRVGYGPFRLGTLKAGAVEEVGARVLRDQLGLGDGAETDAYDSGPGGSADGKTTQGAAGSGKSGSGRAAKPARSGAGRAPAGAGDTAAESVRGKRPVRARKSGGSTDPRPADPRRSGGSAGPRPAASRTPAGGPPKGPGEKPRRPGRGAGKGPRHRL